LKLVVLNQPVFMNMALVARAMLQEVGVTLDVEPREGGSFWNSGKDPAAKELDLFLLRFSGKHDPNFLLQWFQTSQIGVWNWQRWSSPQFDKLFTDAAGELDPAKRVAMVVEAQRLMDESAAFIWLTNEANFLVHRPWIRPAAVPGWIDWQYDSFGLAT
jgi:peptide/nickel transport system substrate-binding protein